MVKPKVFIENQARNQLQRIYNFIKRDSVKNAERIRGEIITSIKELVNNPEQYPFDRFRKNNDGSYRAFEMYKYRITYYISEEKIIVIRIRHTKRDSSEY